MATRRHLANAIRALSMDAVQKAQSGHPGAPMALLRADPHSTLEIVVPCAPPPPPGRSRYRR